MSYTTQEEFQSALAGWNKTQEILQQFASDYVKEFCGKKEHVSEAVIEEGKICIRTEAYYCGCCGPDYECYLLPFEYLWTDWRVTEQVARDKQKQIREEEAKRKKEQEETARQEQRYKQFLSMKKEFEAQ